MASTKHKTARSAPHSHRRKHYKQGFYTPFEDLDQLFTHISTTHEVPSRSLDDDSCVTERPEDGDRLFQAAMADVEPFHGEGRRRIPPPPQIKQPPRFMEMENTDVYRHLVNLVKGEAPIEVWYSDEYVDGAVVGLSPAILRKLKRGDLSYQDYIDLHGCKREEAYEKVTHFVKRSVAGRLRCILIVSGRGLNSRERRPVLKQELVRWLTHAPLRRHVLAFTSARSCDGGAGAFYVLLRRNEAKAPFVMPAR